jgi:hypothetical protein
MITGTITGEVMNICMAILSLPGRRCMPMAAIVPRAVASAVVATAIRKLLRIAVIQFSEANNCRYQRRDIPSSGKVRNDPPLKESGMMTSTGRMRNSRVAAQAARKPSRQLLSRGLALWNVSM